MGRFNVGMRGRQPKKVMIDGCPTQLRKAIDWNYSTAIFLPKEWISALQLVHGAKPEYFTVEMDIDELTL